MYTEDDEKVTIKKNNSNIEYSDFYTSFNDIEKEETVSKKKKPKEEKVLSKEENDSFEFYDNNNNTENFQNDNKKKIIKIIIIAVLSIIFILLMIFLFAGKEKKVVGDIELVDNNIVLNLGETKYISYKIVNTESKVTPTFTSSDSSVATVSSSGEIMAVGEGNAIITIQYTIDGQEKQKNCNVKIKLDDNVNKNIELSLVFKSGSNDTWINNDAVISVDAKSVFGIMEIKYAINCDSDCSYNSVSNNTITISNEGITKVKVLAKDKKNQETSKELTVKIDKSAPSAKLNSGTNITSSNDVNVCVICDDALSGCKQNQVCKKYTSSKSNQTITVSDNAGNTKVSESFNVKINKKTVPPSCTLSVSSKGIITATVKGDLNYYGFNSKYSGSNTKTMQASINATKAGEEKAQLINYYVKDKSGNTAKCYITVIKKCSCSSGSGSNCPVSCTFTSQ